MLTKRKIVNLQARIGKLYRLNRSITFQELQAEIISLGKRNGNYDDLHSMIAAAIENAGIDIRYEYRRVIKCSD